MNDSKEVTSDFPSTVPNPLRNSPIRNIIRRIIFGVLFVLPMVLTVFVVYQIYRYLNAWIIDPVASFVVPQGIDDPVWTAIEKYVTPPISLLTVMLLLYFLGYAFQSRLSRWVDWFFSYIPGVSMLYRAIRDASQAIQGPDGLKAIDTVVLVPFPHASARATGFLMGESRDIHSGKHLACVYVPIALFPPSGYTLLFPYDDVIKTGWEASSPWKLLLSGGLTLPAHVPFDKVGQS